MKLYLKTYLYLNDLFFNALEKTILVLGAIQLAKIGTVAINFIAFM